MKPPPGKVIDCIKTIFIGAEYGVTTYYVLTQDGNLSSWTRAPMYLGSIQAEAIPYLCILPLGGLAFGSFLGLGVFTAYLIYFIVASVVAGGRKS